MASVTVEGAVGAAHVDTLKVGEAGFAVSGADASSGDIILKLKAGSGVNLTTGNPFSDSAEIFVVKYAPGTKIIIEM